jgi:hypothetical protein
MRQTDSIRRRLSGRAKPFPAAVTLSAPDRLVGIGFRCWIAGFQQGDIGAWELAWDAFSRAVGPRAAKPLMSDLACWVHAVQDTAERRIEINPAQCRRFCRDECLAISMIAAAQHSACPAIRACAVALLGSPRIDEAMQGAEEFAAQLREADQLLSPGTLFMGADIISPGLAGHG